MRTQFSLIKKIARNAQIIQGNWMLKLVEVTNVLKKKSSILMVPVPFAQNIFIKQINILVINKFAVEI